MGNDRPVTRPRSPSLAVWNGVPAGVKAYGVSGAGNDDVGVEIGDEVKDGALEGGCPEGKMLEGCCPEGREVTTWCREVGGGRDVASFKLDSESASRTGEVVVAYAMMTIYQKRQRSCRWVQSKPVVNRANVRVTWTQK